MHAQCGWQIVKQWAGGARSWCAAGLLATGFLALGGCSSGGAVDLGDNQSGDPATVDFPIFYVKRAVPRKADGTLMQDDLRILRFAVPSADLFMRAAPRRAARKPTSPRASPTGALWDVKDVDTSPDGKTIVFAMRGPLAMKQDEEGALVAHLGVRHRHRRPASGDRSGDRPGPGRPSTMWRRSSCPTAASSSPRRARRQSQGILAG